jgi:hypothetical protein
MGRLSRRRRDHRRCRAALALTAVGIAAATGCSPSQSATSTTVSINGPSTAARPETSLTATEATAPCPTNELLNLPQPTPLTVTTVASVRIVGIAAEPYPGGPNAYAGRIDGRPLVGDLQVFETARAAVPIPLPAPGEQGCCRGGDVATVYFSDRQHATYGPCVLAP